MNNSGNSSGSGILVAIVVIVLVVILAQCGRNDYDRTARSAYSKMATGNYDQMNDKEKSIMNGFFDWLDD